MSVTLALLSPLAVLNAAIVPSPEAESRRFADALVKSYVCEHLGFGVNYAGLAGWGEAIRGRLVLSGASREAALLHMRDDIRDERSRFTELHGMAVWQTASLTNVGAQAQYRFQKTFMDRCRALVRSDDAGAFFTAPERRLSGAVLGRKTRAMLLRFRKAD